MEINNVVDNNGVSYQILRRIGEGSQGETFLLDGGEHIVKLFKNAINETGLKSTISFLIKLDLDKQLYSVPKKEIVSPKCGYISEFASGMSPLSDLMTASKNMDFETWFKESGGLLKRYGVLIKLASAIRSLHAKGLVYCDLSPNNVFISSNPNKHSVFLIDMDNLRYKTSIIHNIYTPFYGAPEVVKNLAPNTTMSDCYSFSVLAYKLLTFSHPLIGDMVNNGEPEIEDRALMGEFPWVENPMDDCNHRETGLTSSLFVSNKLMDLFHRTFEGGLKDPMKRPTMAEWVDSLNDALNDLLLCKKCGIHYLYNNHKHCPFCDSEPILLTALKIQRWEEEEFYNQALNSVESRFSLQPIIFDKIIIDCNTPKYIKSVHLLSSGNDENLPIARLQLEPLGDGSNFARLIISPLNESKLFFMIPELNINDIIEREKRFKFNPLSHKTMIIGAQEFTFPQRVLVI